MWYQKQKQIIILYYLSKGTNLVHGQPDIWPPNFFMEISQGPLDMSKNTF